MPPMPPPGGMPGAPLGSGLSPTIASVVINSPATEAASCSATRPTLVGSMIPAATMSLYSPDCASKPKFGSSLSVSLPTTIEPSTPEFSAICRTGDWMALQAISMPTFWSLLAGLRPASIAWRGDRLDRGKGGEIADPILHGAEDIEDALDPVVLACDAEPEMLGHTRAGGAVGDDAPHAGRGASSGFAGSCSGTA